MFDASQIIYSIPDIPQQNYFRSAKHYKSINILVLKFNFRKGKKEKVKILPILSSNIRNLTAATLHC